MGIEKKLIGCKINGRDVIEYTLKNSSNTQIVILNYGGIIRSIITEDKKGTLSDIALGYNDINDYINTTKYFGAIIGRVANRIENSVINVNKKEYKLASNDGKNHLHGGKVGYNNYIWDANIKLDDKRNEYLELKYLSKDGEENYPGNLDVAVNYKLTEDNELVIEYIAVSDKDTVVNLTNHSYFNLAGHNSGNILKHKLMINSDKITESDNELISTGKIINVENTPMDFRDFKYIGEEIESDYYQIQYGGGYDQNWIIRESSEVMKKVAEVKEETSGRTMEVYSTMPGVQFYSGNFLEGEDKGKDGCMYQKRTGFCLETQYFPNALKHSHFPSIVLKKDEVYNHKTIYKFSTINKKDA